MNNMSTISIEEWDAERDLYIMVDVRSPKEFEEFHIPGAVNLPIFLNEERARVGTLYKQKGQESAKELGIEIVSEKLPHLYKTIKDLASQNKKVVIYCWRGGMRSRSIVTVMRMMGIACEQLQGGIRSFRKKIVSEMDEYALMDKPFVIIEGCTGTRKTDLLLELQQQNYPVIDLEGLAGHRGSIFGGVGLVPRTQKQFESDLLERLRQLRNAPYYIIEGESKRIGNVVLPQFIIEGKEKGHHLYIDYPFKKRIESIYRTYQPDEEHDALYQAFLRLKKYLQPVIIEKLDQAFKNKDYHELIGVLLEYYYDPRYLHKIESYQTPSQMIVMETLNEGLNKIRAYLAEHYDLISIS